MATSQVLEFRLVHGKRAGPILAWHDDHPGQLCFELEVNRDPLGRGTKDEEQLAWIPIALQRRDHRFQTGRRPGGRQDQAEVPRIRPQGVTGSQPEVSVGELIDDQGLIGLATQLLQIFYSNAPVTLPLDGDR